MNKRRVILLVVLVVILAVVLACSSSGELYTISILRMYTHCSVSYRAAIEGAVFQPGWQTYVFDIPKGEDENCLQKPPFIEKVSGLGVTESLRVYDMIMGGNSMTGVLIRGGEWEFLKTGESYECVSSLDLSIESYEDICKKK